MSGSIGVNNLSPKTLKFIINTVFAPLLETNHELDSLTKSELIQLVKTMREEVRNKAISKDVIKAFTSWFDLDIIRQGFTTESWRKAQSKRFLNNINEAFHHKVMMCKDCGYYGKHSEWC